MQLSALLMLTNFVKRASMSAFVNWDLIPIIPGLCGFINFLKSSKLTVTTKRLFLIAF